MCPYLLTEARYEKKTENFFDLLDVKIQNPQSVTPLVHVRTRYGYFSEQDIHISARILGYSVLILGQKLEEKMELDRCLF